VGKLNIRYLRDFELKIDELEWELDISSQYKYGYL
jgi:hypothetical protein